jgi:pimeloyl-ACP methyl ester carboxylesterase
MTKIPLLIAGIMILAAVIAFLLSVSSRIGVSQKMEHVTLTTSDGVTIAADFYRGGGQRGMVLLHMMPATKESWRDFGRAASDHGWDVIAIDLRGHGASQGGHGGYRSFSDEEHQQSIRDVEAAVRYLTERGIPRSAITIVGASIGANLALWYAAEHPEIKEVILLSPGIEYRGIRAEPLMQKVAPGARVMLVGSNDDMQSDDRVLQRIAAAAPPGATTKTIVFQSAGHGTAMFGKEKPDLTETMFDWLQ